MATEQVYPRTGGGNPRWGRRGSRRAGLSPHGRGKHLCGGRCWGRQGSIPARAGETINRVNRSSFLKVYPRTGGGNADKAPGPIAGQGLSPHGRGKPPPAVEGAEVPGSIPARAGETLPPAPPNTPPSVYPRTGGGNPPLALFRSRCLGLSPHGRGKPNELDAGQPVSGSIPARAGETYSESPSPAPPPVYPRTGGGNQAHCHPPGRQAGLSPHGRGKPRRRPVSCCWGGSIPARAGETARCRSARSLSWVYPRTGGGNRQLPTGGQLAQGLSPHGRGKPA